MHFLDFIMYFVTCGVIWLLLDIVFAGEITREANALGYMVIIMFWTVIYFILFVWPVDYNWVDIFNSHKFSLTIKW